MHTRRLVSALTAATVVLLAGCGASEPTAPEAAAPSSLTVWYMTGSLPDDVAADLKKDFEGHPSRGHRGVPGAAVGRASARS
jgi:ABC-type glycerol-3-phosphate transport system substrate-binding protein